MNSFALFSKFRSDIKTEGDRNVLQNAGLKKKYASASAFQLITLTITIRHFMKRLSSNLLQKTKKLKVKILQFIWNNTHFT